MGGGRGGARYAGAPELEPLMTAIERMLATA